MTADALAVQHPFPWPVLLAYIAGRRLPGLERVSASGYTRHTPHGRLRVGFDGRALRLTGAARSADSTAAVARIFQPVMATDEAAAVLGACPLLAPRLRVAPGLRPPGAWSAFELCVRTLVGQQVSVAAANTLTRRLIRRCGGLDAPRVAGANLDGIGMPQRRVDAIQGFAGKVARGELDLHAPWPDLHDALTSMPGFGPWTRAYLAIRLGRDTDAFPASDVGLLRAVGAANPAALLRLAERWRPYRGLAAAYLWAVPA